VIILQFSGDTVRLTAEFKNWSGSFASPSNVTVKIYDASRTIIHTGTAVQSEVGKFYYDYTLPDTRGGELTFEFAGILEGSPILGRAKIDRRFI
jgi:hypothetical protein